MTFESRRSGNRPPVGPGKLIIILFLVLVLLFVASLSMGRFNVAGSELATFFFRLLSGAFSTEPLTADTMVIWWLRVPRCLMAVMVGMSLSLSGAVYQGLFRNPLVSPDILGVAAGCTFGAALGLVLPGHSFALVHLLSFAFGLLAVYIALGIARLVAVKPVIVLVLAGMVVLSFFNALLMVVKYFSDPLEELPTIVFWIMGSLTRVTWTDVIITAPFCLGILVLFLLLRFRLNILSLGDLQARAHGVEPRLFRFVLISASSLIVAITVSVCGQIAWIGLVVPHIARTLVGPDHKHMLPVTALLGSILLLAADDAARSLTTSEIPVGIITALAGAPVFAYLLFRNRGSGWM